MTFGLVHASHSLPEGQAVKLSFFAPEKKEPHSYLRNLTLPDLISSCEKKA